MHFHFPTKEKKKQQQLLFASYYGMDLTGVKSAKQLQR